MFWFELKQKGRCVDGSLTEQNHWDAEKAWEIGSHTWQ
jgi:hypothetical protein